MQGESDLTRTPAGLSVAAPHPTGTAAVPTPPETARSGGGSAWGCVRAAVVQPHQASSRLVGVVTAGLVPRTGTPVFASSVEAGCVTPHRTGRRPTRLLRFGEALRPAEGQKYVVCHE